ncbi:pyruvate/oxaloacetate carboxyltransferase,Methylmalonyl-CoA carboxyltransferase 5S subunit,oxaloacetate decarboxylase,Pyruvate/oxaloacetate carboxyltransferase,oxaloacetate decarboxylase alpha subunit,Conserved carboxylase domain [[Clostridium] sordellii]|uniref:oxaloacetate decarboxylase subunit alpha n=1 Tax=Paraclostridium sordellii TaxID=1505 RepID=UPI0005436043|nr:oxaloacetate decarboxylase subunit alpha [Paeniclostridium sordellii]CEK33068.1 pyruvate/oxaloacetate carboxyltransferase,Methylmalonyl-CoA carboxyltransferase 5S subunit,oxaloacetate decarboxylase,Pyruvate/oxaloacetate carboxyltransferase,oxaloacetate decarboxylase alpha subunit,Conserved carboxylase domain [[Clostridium] sordellii] [Paeniclostridium sordellii]
MNQLKITETALRDGHQSLIATRLTTEEIIPILETMDKVGYHSMEVWGGATFDACIRFLNEDPWERLREIRKRVKNTKLQMLLRGQNLLGYRNYADDLVDKFIKLSIDNGIDIIRVFDALNDVRNIDASMKAIKKYGGHCQCAISYTTSDVHTTEYYLELLKTMESMGADSICIKDMAGVLTPYNAYDLVKKMKSISKLPIELHTHCTSGIADMIYMKAVEAGVDIIDTAISPFSGGTSQPPTESLAVTFSEMERNPGLNMDALLEVAEYFKPIRDKYMENGTLNPKVLLTEPQTLNYKVPGGMLSNLLSQLKQQNATEKYEDVLKEVPRVRADLGYPPLVTPMSQMVGTQALFNVLTGERYKLVPKEIKDYVKGQYGKAPAPIDEEVKKKIIGDEEVVTVRPADLLEPEFEKIKLEAGVLAKCDEDVITYALFPQVAPKFLENKYNPEKKDESSEENKIHYITVTM